VKSIAINGEDVLHQLKSTIRPSLEHLNYYHVGKATHSSSATRSQKLLIGEVDFGIVLFWWLFY